METEWKELADVIEYINKKKYSPKTSMKHLAISIMVYSDCDEKRSSRLIPISTLAGGVNIPQLDAYVNANGGLSAFDL